jgi:hypothetical protein
VANICQRFNGRIGHASLDGGNVCPVYMGIESQRLLRLAGHMTTFLDPFSKSGTDGRGGASLWQRMFGSHD